jgi:hypothetical protein
VKVNAVTDGGLGLYPSTGKKLFPMIGVEVHISPVNCLREAKRKKKGALDPGIVIQKHAGQIYAEMLGQVCHEGLYTSDPNGYQEVVVGCGYADASLSFFMLDMQHIFYSLPNSRILIYEISSSTGTNT